MLWFSAVLTLVLFLGVTSGQDATPNLISQFQVLIKERCAMGGHENALYELQQAMEQMKSCSSKIQPCAALSVEFYACLDNFLQKLASCLDAEEKYLLDLIPSTFNSFLEKQCQHVGTPTCKKDIDKVGPLIDSQCLPQLNMFEVLQTYAVLTQEDFCSDLPNLLACAVKVADEYCEDISTSAAIGDILEPYIQWCQKHK